MPPTRSPPTGLRLAELVVPRHMVTTWMTAGQLHARLRLGETGQVDAVLAGLDGEQRETGVMRIVLATLRLARGDPQAASDALAAVLDGSVPMPLACSGMAQAFLLEAIARDALGDTPAAGRALEHALDLSEPLAVPPPPGAGAARAASPGAYRSSNAGQPDPPPARPGSADGAGHPRRPGAATGKPGAGDYGGAQGGLRGVAAAEGGIVPRREQTLCFPLPAAEPLTASEIRVLRYL
ncbi:MAG TPA: hypothetical protein VMK13_18665 [Streptosporangiaceae bacterium]|nr:hypothetical protein [Streptosporangiaceae bacterium]